VVLLLRNVQLEVFLAFKDYINSHQVFNTEDLRQELGFSSTVKNLLSRAIANGKVERVRRGLLVSKTGRFEGAVPDPFEIANSAVDDALFCLLSALQLHSGTHNVVFATQFYTQQHLKRFAYNGNEYAPLRYPTPAPDAQSILTLQRQRFAVTSPEQTLLDCLNNIRLVGGVENLLRSLGGLTYLNSKKLLELSNGLSQTGAARLGWTLEANNDVWNTDPEVFEELQGKLKSGPFYFYSGRPPKDSHWVSKWQLYLPFEELEMITWLHQ
jgi:predicted transcriptional regulator of viral defense system